MNDAQYFDRYGSFIALGLDDRPQERRGIFGLIVSPDNWCLITWPDEGIICAELPGGGIEPGEKAYDALLREVYEETGVVVYGRLNISKRHSQHVKLYAEDMPAYLDYDQEFWLIRLDHEPDDFFAEKRTNPEGGLAQWVPLEQLAELSMHAAHRPAISALLD